MGNFFDLFKVVRIATEKVFMWYIIQFIPLIVCRA